MKIVRVNSFVNLHLGTTSFVPSGAFFAALALLCLFAAPGITGQTPSPTPVKPATRASSPTPTPTPVSKDKSRAKGKSDANLITDDSKLPSEPPIVAPDYEAPKITKISPERIGIDRNNLTPLSMEEAVRLALENNNDVDIAQNDVKIAEFDLQLSHGAYDPEIFSESFFRTSISPVSLALQGGGTDGTLRETLFSGNVGLLGNSPFQGGQYTATFSTARLNSDNVFALLNPVFNTSFSLQYTQPLFRGRRTDDNRRNIEIAKKNLSLTDSQFRQKVIEIISKVEAAYWELVYALRNMQVQIDAVREARQQVESNQRQVAQGVLAPIDVVAARTQVSNFEQNLFLAQESVTRTENALKTLILPDRSSSMWSNPLVPITPISLEPPTIPLEESIKTALANRPEINQLTTSKEINDIDKRFYMDQTKPRIDLVGSYTADGLAGTFNPSRIPILGVTVPPQLIGGYPQSVVNLMAQRYPTFQVGVQISIPFRNTVAKANLGKTLVQEIRIKNQRTKTEQLIEADVRNALQMMRSIEARLKVSADARNSAELQYESEQRKQRAGTSTVFLVLQRQTDLITARGRELKAQTDLNKAITEYYRAIGTILKAAGVTYKDRKSTKPSRTTITTLLGRPVYKFGQDKKGN